VLPGILFPLIHFYFFSNQQDTMPATTESLGSMSTSGLLSSEAEIAALCEVSNAESGGTEERNDDLKNKSV
jgi:hypothetical protein